MKQLESFFAEVRAECGATAERYARSAFQRGAVVMCDLYDSHVVGNSRKALREVVPDFPQNVTTKADGTYAVMTPEMMVERAKSRLRDALINAGQVKRERKAVHRKIRSEVAKVTDFKPGKPPRVVKRQANGAAPRRSPLSILDDAMSIYFSLRNSKIPRSAEDIGRGLHMTSEYMALPLKLLARHKLIKVTGDRRATRYERRMSFVQGRAKLNALRKKLA